MAASTQRTTMHRAKTKKKGASTLAPPLSETTTSQIATVEGAWQQADDYGKQTPLQPARKRSRFSLRGWTRQRPLMGSVLVLLAGLLVLWGPLALFQFAFLPGSTIWAGLLVGAVLIVLGLIQLFAPSYALLTGALAIVFSLASLIAALGGFGIGMILGIIGGAQGVAWRSSIISWSDYQRLLDKQAHQPRKHLRWRRRK